MTYSLDPNAAARRMFASSPVCTERDTNKLHFEVGGHRATLTYQVEKRGKRRTAWSVIRLPITRRYPLLIGWYSRPLLRSRTNLLDPDYILEGAPLEISNRLLDREALAPFRRLEAAHLGIVADRVEAEKRSIALRFKGWFFDPIAVVFLIEHLVSIAQRIPILFSIATQATESVQVSTVPFREQLEVVTQRDPVPQWFAEVHELRRRVRKRRWIVSIAVSILFAAAIAAIALHG